MNDSFQYGDIIFLALVAIFVAFRLRAMLGKNTGLDPSEVWKNATRNVSPPKMEQFADRNTPKTEEEPEYLKDKPEIAKGLQAIKKADNAFSTTDFLSGAKIAFEWVVEAFSKGDKEKLRKILSAERFKHFSDEIDVRKADEVKHETTLVSILNEEITEASLTGNTAHITVQFTTEQINVMRDKQNKVVGGDPSQIEKAIDIWTFERDVSSRDPNWKIIAT